MSDFKKLLSRWDKSKVSRDQVLNPDGTDNLLGLFGDENDRLRIKISEKELEKKVMSYPAIKYTCLILQKIKDTQDLLLKAGITKYREQDITFVLKSSYIGGDALKAADSLILLRESEEGIVKAYNPKLKLKGAVNHNGVSCYLDSILFAMLCRMESFEAMLYNSFEDAKRNDLVILIRLWVNTIREGKLVEADLTKRIQEALANCGWLDAAQNEQEDASEAFTFITDNLNLPMLTLKMDLFHFGKEDDKDDHKFIRERLLEVAVPDDKTDGQTITLEECLETYFNSRVEVKRYLERRGTGAYGSGLQKSSTDPTKKSAVNVETTEIIESAPSTPAEGPPFVFPSHPSTRPEPYPLKHRAPSIIQDMAVYDDEKAMLKADLDRANSFPRSPTTGRIRAGTLRKEVLMPAWQFFSLIPWYTDIEPNSDAQIEAHLETKRPVLGICLKRYTYTNSGEAIRRGTHIDIPIEIGLPHFIHDVKMDANEAAFGKFKLSLQSVVCHRGRSVHEGHYVSLVRGVWPDGEDKWVLFDDLASERIRPIDIARALHDECPYLLFYQIQPIEDPSDISRGERPPSYLSDARDSNVADLSRNPSILNSKGSPSTGRSSFEEIENIRYRGRTSFNDERRSSIPLSQESTVDAAKPEIATSRPDTPGKESKPSKRGSYSRNHSPSGETRLSRSFQNLAGKLAALNTPLNKVDSGFIVGSSLSPELSAYAEMSGKHSGSNTEALSDNKAKLRKAAERSLDKSRGHSTLGTRHLTKGKRGERPDRECSVM
ncbi:MAG: hypothetical protein GOMPHAMPRED_006470 [Gomphillus americanus]|uniref:ubiquitinyl hydrolase 1 n=1 Tax=Gomphillus americanus TaxID=1940652 RepID=A0A8H3FXP5_9LECA|nr:MAG: hypothetical protein GOMPHAMPRED_006470 [Gomphillus americanus]